MLKVSRVVATVDEGIVKKILELVGKGVYQVRDIERHLKIFVKNDFVKTDHFQVILYVLQIILGELLVKKRENEIAGKNNFRF